VSTSRLFEPSHVPVPPPPERRWDPSKPLDLELGCGAGWFAIQSAVSHPEREYIAIEHAALRFSKFWGRFERHGRPCNLYPVRAHAVYWVHHYLPLESVDRVFLLYPNPYPKEAQKNKRWYAMPFFPELVKRLKVGGQLWLATNELFYADGFEAACEKWKLQSVEKATLRGDKAVARTHFEKKFLEAGVPCYQRVFIRRGGEEPCGVER
jgi:tRNA G46 methylase TrmB